MADSCDDDDGDGDSDGAATDAFGGKYDPGYKYQQQQPTSKTTTTVNFLAVATCNALKFTCHKFPHKAADSASASAATDAVLQRLL